MIPSSFDKLDPLILLLLLSASARLSFMFQSPDNFLPVKLPDRCIGEVALSLDTFFTSSSWLLRIVVDTDPFVKPERPNSSTLSGLSFPEDLKYDLLESGPAPPIQVWDGCVVDEPMRWEREKKLLKSGFRVAKADAVIPSPGSTVDPDDMLVSNSCLDIIKTDILIRQRSHIGNHVFG